MLTISLRLCMANKRTEKAQFFCFLYENRNAIFFLFSFERTFLQFCFFTNNFGQSKPRYLKRGLPCDIVNITWSPGVHSKKGSLTVMDHRISHLTQVPACDIIPEHVPITQIIIFYSRQEVVCDWRTHLQTIVQFKKGYTTMSP